MTFAKIWIQVKKGWGDIHQEAEVLRERVARLETLLRAHNLDPNSDVDSQQS